MSFGKQLRKFRLLARSPGSGKPISQEALGKLLYEEMGIQYTGAAISDWERGKSRINADDRLLLISLAKIFARYGGIKTPDDANLLLESGNFRALNKSEMEKLFPDYQEAVEAYVSSQNRSIPQRLFEYLHFIPPSEYTEMLDKAKRGPDPYWPRVAVSLTRKFADDITASGALRGIIWLWIIWLAYEFFITPSLAWDFESREKTVRVMAFYAAGSLLIPALIGGLTNTKDNPYWAAQNMHRSILLRLYVHQGAYVGYHLGYFIVLLTVFTRVLLGLRLPEWMGIFQAIFPLVISYAGARLIPYNLWLAYSRLDIRDGGIFFIFAALGPLWALFLLEFHDLLSSPILLAVIILSALTIIATTEVLKTHKNNRRQQ